MHPSSMEASRSRDRRQRRKRHLRLVAAPAPATPEPPHGDATESIAMDAIDRRVTYLLRLCDRNDDDILDARDFEEWVDRLGALRGWEPGCDGYQVLTELFVVRSWGGLHAAVGREDGTIALPAMRAGLRGIAQSHPEQARGWADALYDLLDPARSGRIGREQYRDLLASLCVAREDADASFAHLDAGDRGYLTRDEFAALYLGFFLDVDPDAPAACFWGPCGCQAAQLRVRAG